MPQVICYLELLLPSSCPQQSQEFTQYALQESARQTCSVWGSQGMHLSLSSICISLQWERLLPLKSPLMISCSSSLFHLEVKDCRWKSMGVDLSVHFNQREELVSDTRHSFFLVPDYLDFEGGSCLFIHVALYLSMKKTVASAM